MRSTIVAIALASFLAAYVTATSDSSRSNVIERQAPFESNRITTRIIGTGLDVILIAGAGSSSKAWETTVTALPNYRFHLIDVRGFAGIPASGNGNGTVLAPIAKEVERYIKEQRLNRPAIIGHSMGGTVAMLIGINEPDLPSKIMVVDMLPFLGAMFGPPGSTAQSVKPVAEQVQQGMLAMLPDDRNKQIEATINAMVSTPSMRQIAVNDSVASDPKVSAQVMYDLITLDLRSDLARLRVPLQVLYVTPVGAPVNDAQIDSWYQASYEMVPQRTLTRVPDSSHFIMWDNPTFFQSKLIQFLR
jgi:pimeloyl-ACP methyl ester carboxylesterase